VGKREGGGRYKSPLLVDSLLIPLSDFWNSVALEKDIFF